MVWAVAVDSVLRQSALAPGVSAADAVDIEVNVKVDKLAALQLVRVFHIHILFAVVPGAYAERLAAVNAQRTAG